MKVARTLIPLILLLPSACARVDPRNDYRDARELARQRGGAADAYDPETDTLVDQKTRDLLAAGLTVDRAVQLTLLRNRGFQSLFAELGASRADVVQSGLLSNPTLSLAAQFPDGGGRSMFTLGLGQELVDLWQIPIRRRVAEHQLDQVLWRIAQQAADLAGEARTRAFLVLTLRETQRITRENLQLVERSYNLANDRYRAGEVGQIDVNLVQANLLAVRLELVNLARDLRQAEAALGRSLGLSRWTEPWSLDDALPPTRSLSQADAELVAVATEQRPDSRAAQAAIDAARGDLKRQWLNVVPSVMAGVQEERQDRRALPGRNIAADTLRASGRAGTLTAPDIQTKAERDLERRQIVDSLLGPTLQITLPIWDQNQAQIAKSAFLLVQRQKQREDLLDQIAADVQGAAAAVRAAVDIVRFYDEQSLPLARRNVDAARRAYQAGEQSILVLIEAQESLITQQRDRARALGMHASTWAELERVMGGRSSLPASTAPASKPAEKGTAGS